MTKLLWAHFRNGQNSAAISSQDSLNFLLLLFMKNQARTQTEVLKVKRSNNTIQVWQCDRHRSWKIGKCQLLVKSVTLFMKCENFSSTVKTLQCIADSGFKSEPRCLRRISCGVRNNIHSVECVFETRAAVNCFVNNPSPPNTHTFSCPLWTRDS